MAMAKEKASRLQARSCVIGCMNMPKVWRMPSESETTMLPQTSSSMAERGVTGAFIDGYNY